MDAIKTKMVAYYEKYELRFDIAFFLGGFVFDILLTTDVDLIGIVQQLVYLGLIAVILYADFLAQYQDVQIPKIFRRIWNYRNLILHFLLGSLLSVYSLFFLKSASISSSIIFVILLMGLMVANEFKTIRHLGVNVKVPIFYLCIFSFASLIFPHLLGFVGWTPFLLSLGTTAGLIYLIYRRLRSKIDDTKILMRAVLAPGISVLIVIFGFYWLGLIPPVPISVKSMGVYHKIEKVDGKYLLHYERPWWKFWQNGDQDFSAEPQDQIYFFASIFSPVRFDDTVILHWSFKDPRQGWMTSDKIPMKVTGGRASGFRGFAVKKNYSAGFWRAAVETTDGREIGRLSFNVEMAAAANPERQFEIDSY